MPTKAFPIIGLHSVSMCIYILVILKKKKKGGSAQQDFFAG